MRKNKTVKPTIIKFTRCEILQTKYRDLSFLFIPVEQADKEIEEILKEIQSVGFGC